MKSLHLALVDLVTNVAERKNATLGQVALAWLLAQKPWIVPIPGTRRLERLDENLASANLDLTPEDLAELDQVVLVGDATELASQETAERVEGVGVPPARDLFRKLLDNNVPVYV